MTEEKKEEIKVDFEGVITIKGDKSFWQLSQEEGGILLLTKIGEGRDEKGGYSSLIPHREEFRGDEVVITKGGAILSLGGRLLINTEKEAIVSPQ